MGSLETAVPVLRLGPRSGAALTVPQKDPDCTSTPLLPESVYPGAR